jgi:hypothetical protein
MMKVLFTSLVLLFCLSFNLAQAPSIPKKQTQAMRSTQSVKIDGLLDEEVWSLAPASHSFIQNSPTPGVAPSQPTEVKVLYDNTAIYIGALLHDARPDSIFKEMTERDQFGNSDWFAVIFDPYRDGNNGVGFAVTPTGIQLDTKFSPTSRGGGFGGILYSGERTWDAVWDSEAKITDKGWIVEMKIPYSALRFPNMQEQVWHINFVREIRRHRELSYWNEVNPNLEGYLNQSGVISGIVDVKSPLRLSATPFIAFYEENLYDKSNSPKSAWSRSINGGMDVKYGINDAFTLDMTLIPDFGQVRTDNRVLNLSPFEIRFDENRQFFTEGTELFNKGGLFYSRRVGGQPIHYSDTYDATGEEEVVSNPSETQLINATKVSGRTNSGLGIGVFNAVSARTTATIRNKETSAEREVESSPLTNYNILVLDQNLPNNSYVTFTNTNVMRNGETYDANATGARVLFRNKAQSLAVDGRLNVSQKYFSDFSDFGHSFFTRIARTKGKLQGGIGYSQESFDYDPNDLGFLFNPNEKNVFTWVEFNQAEPFGKFNEARIEFNVDYGRLYKPDVFSDFGMGFESFMLTKSRFAFGIFTWFQPFETFDYFEPRTTDFSRYYRFPTSFNLGGFISTDYRKKFAFDLEGNYRKFNESGRRRFNLSISPRLRVNDQLSFTLSIGSYNFKNDVGYVTKRDNGDIIFGIRDNVTVENTFNATYIFSNRMSFSFRLRHYWSKAEYHRLVRLDEEGRLAPTDLVRFSDNSYDFFSVDAVYRWRFAPGSDIYIVWKNNTEGYADEPDRVLYSYRDGASDLWDLPQRNNLSLKLIYFLDYLYLKKKD